ncbi:glycosyltransferase family 2 protein [Candidatus Uhrbacteria bacterium]|nr:glycosyltransferase family 2 protein [Candidatus Uhrbacteria bacterium]
MSEQSAFERRCFEILPGLLMWATFIAGVVLSMIHPLWVIYFIILFDLYWLLRVSYFIIVVLFAWRNYARALTTDWYARMERHKGWKEIYHLIFLPMVKEDHEIVESTLQALRDARFPKERMMVVLAGEERAGEHFQTVAAAMEKKYGTSFFRFFSTTHPDTIPGEMKTKGANLNYSGHTILNDINALGIPYEHIIVSAFDVDTIAHPDYFACLTDAYLSNPKPTRSSYQPVVLYNNNIWHAPSPTRLAAFSTTFWLMTELARPDRLFTFASHSMSFQALVDVDFWQKDMVNEDSRIFLQCFMKYHGDYTVVPLYVPLSMDTVSAPTLWRSLWNLYKQQRRWAYGVEHFPYLMKHFLRDSLIPLRKKMRILWNQLEGMYTWATAPILILVLGRLPLLFASGDVQSLVIVQSAPRILEILLNLSMLGIFVIGFLSFFLLPPQPRLHPTHRRLTMVLQWLLLPITIILFSALPAIEAQTRLMIGRYLGFAVTDKHRSN